MLGNTKIITFAAVIAMLSPAATATWMSYGSSEPDTAYDEDGMFIDPPEIGEKKLYFNAFTTGIAGITSLAAVNPNVGALQTQNEVASSEFHFAILGVWTDCNGDGYVGMAETAIREYDSRLLLDESVCPRNTGSANSWAGGHHNYNGWVTEFIPLSTGAGLDKRTYRDDEARIWGDFGRPDRDPSQRSCTLSPQTRGTYQTTGGFLNWLDCRVDILGASNQVNGNINDPAGLSYGDTDEARQAGHPLHQDTAGDESSANSAVYYADCSAAPTFRFNSTETVDDSGAPIGGALDGSEIIIPALNPRPGSATPTIAGTMNTTREEADWFVFGSGDCDYTNDNGGDVYEGTCQITTPCVGEGDFNGINPKKKNEADWNFAYNPVTSRGSVPMTLWGGSAGGDSSLGSYGLSLGGPGGGWSNAGTWSSDSVWLSKPGFGVVKADLSSGGIGLADAYYLTFYAAVGEATTTAGIAVPGSGVYGSWNCGSETTGIHHGFVCDRAKWYLDQNGDPLPGGDDFARPGDAFVAMDVDCYDGGNSLGAGVQPASYGAAPCA